jgi:hypothetical protein
MVAYRLVDLVGRASAANILGMSIRDLDKLVDTFQLSERLPARSLREAPSPPSPEGRHLAPDRSHKSRCPGSMTEGSTLRGYPKNSANTGARTFGLTP